MDKIKSLYDEIEHMIVSEVGVQGHPFIYGKFEGLGWLDFQYTSSAYEGPCPKIALKQQKNAVHLYVMSQTQGQPLLEKYVPIFGKTAVGKGCLRIKTLNEARRNAITEIVRFAIEGQSYET